MKRWMILLFLLSAFCLALNASVDAERKKRDPQDDIVHVNPVTLDFTPQSQWIDVVKPLFPPNIRFCGIEIPFELKGEAITVSYDKATMTFKPGDKSLVFEFKKGEKTYHIGFSHTANGWRYFNADVLMIRLNKVKVFGYDLDCDGEYFFPGKDGIMYPGSRCVLPYEVGKFWYDMKIAEIQKEPDGFVLLYEDIKHNKGIIECLKHINWFRVGAGLHPLRIDPVLTKACTQHAGYVAQNGADMIDTPYVEKPGSPGYSEEGKRVAPNSIYYYFGDPWESIHLMLGFIYYRIGFVRANLHEIGIGFHDPISCFNFTKSDNKLIDYKYPIMAPGPEQTIPYTKFYTSTATVIPDPRPGETGCGFPITLTWDWNEKAELVDAKLYSVSKSGKEKAIQITASGPNKPAVTYTGYETNRGMIAIIPLNALKEKARYRVVIKYKLEGKEMVADWYFFTGDGK